MKQPTTANYVLIAATGMIVGAMSPWMPDELNYWLVIAPVCAVTGLILARFPVFHK